MAPCELLILEAEENRAPCAMQSANTSGNGSEILPSRFKCRQFETGQNVKKEEQESTPWHAIEVRQSFIQ